MDKQLLKIKNLLESVGYERIIHEKGDCGWNDVFINELGSVSIDQDDLCPRRPPQKRIARVKTQINGIHDLSYYFCLGSSFYLIDYDHYVEHLKKCTNILYEPIKEKLFDGWQHFYSIIQLEKTTIGN